MTYDVRPNWKTARINGVRRVRRHMQINPRTSVLFGIAGLASGFITVWIYSNESWSESDSAGAIFLVVSAGTLALVKFLGWQSVRFPVSRSVAAAALVSASHPLAIWVLDLTQVVANLFCRLATSPYVCNAQIANLWVGFLITAFSICIAAVGCLSVALWLLTGRWENKEFVFFVLAGIGTTWNSLVLTLLLLDFGWSIKLNGQDWTYFLALAMVGEPIFLIISAKWIFKW